MGLENTDRIAAGLEADVAFLVNNPAEDVRAARSVTAVLVDGAFLTHEQLVAAAQALLEETPVVP